MKNAQIQRKILADYLLEMARTFNIEKVKKKKKTRTERLSRRYLLQFTLKDENEGESADTIFSAKWISSFSS